MRSYTERQAEIDRKGAQELKNNQDFIITTNQWLQKLDTALETMRKEMQEHVAAVGSKLKAQEISFENLVSRNEANKKSCFSELDDNRAQINACVQFVRESLNSSNEKFSLLELCSKSLVDLKDRIEAMEKQVGRIDQLIGTEATRLSNQILAQSNSVKDEILGMPSDIPAIRQTMVDQVNIFKVDFQGLVGEIDLIKKKSFVSSKHIEDLYDRIAKLKQVNG